MIDAPADGTLGHVRRQLPSGESDLYTNGRRLDDSEPLGGPRIRNGAVLSTIRATTSAVPASSTVQQVRVIGGPSSGAILPLRRGRVIVGRGEDSDLVLSDAAVSRKHLRVDVAATAVEITDLNSTNGALVEGVPLGQMPTRWAVDEVVSIGSSALALVEVNDPPAAVHHVDGCRAVNRAPRVVAGADAQPLDAPTPGVVSTARVRLLAAAVPALGGAVLALVLHNAQLLLFTLLTPLIMFATAVGDRVSRYRNDRHDARRYRSARGRFSEAVDSSLRAEARRRRTAHPDPAALAHIASVPTVRIWERRLGDGDFLEVRVGLGVAEAVRQVRTAAGLESAGLLSDVPLVVPLTQGGLGICGPRPAALSLARWVLAQVATLHAPIDVELVLMLSDRSAADWTWVRWLPHSCEINVVPADARNAIAALEKTIAQRRALARDRPWRGRSTLVIVDRPQELFDLAGLGEVIAHGPHFGVAALCLGETSARLPNGCVQEVRIGGETGTSLRLSRPGSDGACASADHVSIGWIEALARDLAATSDATAADVATIPSQCRLIDVLGVKEPLVASLLERWQRPSGPATPIGRGREDVAWVDLAVDGPHALIAGTTGAGKSELLRTLVVGIAAGNPPDDVSFVLIDYKGGAAFADCARLPHVAGFVTDLDPHLTERALVSLRAELHHRERLFAEAGAVELGEYRRTPTHRVSPLGRLVLVVDEFAALADELPKFVHGLVGVAQRGRSLGVHLVLATQRPGGVVSPEIKANLALRVALRTVGAGDSTDLIGDESATQISPLHPGRGFIRRGNDRLAFQTAHTGTAGSAVPPYRVSALDEWGRAMDSRSLDSMADSDLTLLVDAACSAARRSGPPLTRRPWLPALTAELNVAELELTGPGADVIPIGRRDLPGRQAQPPLTLDLRQGGLTLIVGGPRSGRTSALRTIAAQATAVHDPLGLHLYIVDCAGGGLATLGRLPHCGAAVNADDGARVARVIERLAADIAERQSRLTELGVGSSAEAVASGHSPAHAVLLIDGWEAFVAESDRHDAGQTVEKLLHAARDASRVGVCILIAGGRATLTSRLGSQANRRYLLAMADPSDYALAGVPARAVPSVMPAGRALELPDANLVQFAFCGEAPTGQAQNEHIAMLAQAATPVASVAGGPWRVRSLPSRVALDGLPAADHRHLLPVGIGGDEAAPIFFDPWRLDARWLVAGPPRSGRTNFLLVIAIQCLRQAIPVALACSARNSRLIDLTSDANARMIDVHTGRDTALDVLERSEIVLVDDYSALAESTAAEAILDVLHRRPEPPAIVVAGTTDDLLSTYRPLAMLLKRSRAGVLLHPASSDGELFGLRLPRSRPLATPGRGLLIDDRDSGRGVPVQLAMAP